MGQSPVKPTCFKCGKELGKDDTSICLSCSLNSASEAAYPEEYELPKAVASWLKTNFPPKENIDPLTQQIKSHTKTTLQKIEDITQTKNGWKATIYFQTTEYMDWVEPTSELLNNVTYEFKADLTFDDRCFIVTHGKVKKLQ